jgi:Leucine-rich repeat (LRR) protein
MNIENIEVKYPNLQVLDLRGNKIFSIDAVDILYKLKHLHTVNFSRNPIMVHAHLEEMIRESAP